MKTREDIITSMCYTYRHDYGLTKYPDPGGYTFPHEAGMTPEEQKYLWSKMAQIYDNDIAPHHYTEQEMKDVRKQINLHRDAAHKAVEISQEQAREYIKLAGLYQEQLLKEKFGENL